MTNLEIVDGYVYRSEGSLTALVGAVTYTETIRINDETVADVTYEFDLEQGKYVEQSRVERAEPLPPEPLTPEQEIAELRAQLALMQAALDDIILGGDQ